MNRIRVTLVFALLLLVAVAITPGAPKGGVTQRLELDDRDGWIGGAESPMLSYTLTNSGSEDLFVLGWKTPLKGIEHNLFDVRRDGVPVAYTGMLVKRAAPHVSDYLKIEAGGSWTVTFDPSASYDMVQAGEYTIALRESLNAVKAAGRGAEATSAPDKDFKPSTVSFYYEGLSLGTRAPNCQNKPCHPHCPPNPDLCGGGGGGGDPTIEFVSCSSQEQGKALTAIANATSMSAAARADLNGSTSSLYSTWFGAYKSNRYNTVKSNFGSISDAFETQTITINCSDASRAVYAYVYPGSPYEIYVCRYFFQAPNVGRDSAAGTLVHEMSHFNVVASTNDYVYGEAAAQQLAQQDPRRAIKNADNYEYFAEDQ